MGLGLAMSGGGLWAALRLTRNGNLALALFKKRPGRGMFDTCKSRRSVRSTTRATRACNLPLYPPFLPLSIRKNHGTCAFRLLHVGSTWNTQDHIVLSCI